MKRLRSKWLLLGCGLLAAAAVSFVLLGGLSRDDASAPLTQRVKDAWQAQTWAESWDIVSGRQSRFTVVSYPRSAFDVQGRLTPQSKESSLVRVGAKTAPTTWPMFGGTPQRNMVNTVDKDIPIKWSIEEGKQDKIKWVANLGDNAYGGPVVAEGKVFIGTNNSKPRDPKIDGVRAVVMCFNEADGKFLWQTLHDYPDNPLFNEGKPSGLCSTPVVEDGFHYYVTPGCVVVCAKNADGKIAWSYDMMKLHDVVPFHLSNCSPLIVGDHVMIVSGNGVDEEGKVHSPKAPSFLAIHKKTGKLVWSSSLPGDKIIEGQWSNPVVAVVKGKQQVIFPGGDAFLYSFDPADGKLIWKCDCNPERGKEKGVANYMVATPVVVDDKLYLGMGVYPEHPSRPKASWFICLDVTKTGDVSPKSYDVKDAANKGSALVWAFGGLIEPRPARGRQARFGTTISTAAVHDGLIYIPEETGYLHCLDAKTGQRLWDHDFKTAIWGSAFCVDGKVYVGTEDGEVVIFAQGRAAKVLATVGMEERIHSTPVVAGGVLYVATRSKLYAIR